jgi:RHS repeat-associated protein
MEAISGDPSGDTGTIGYAYDAVGNRLARTSSVAAVPTAPSAYDSNDRLTTDTYDDNGNTTGMGGAILTYDFEHRITSVNDGAVSFVYDGDGNRVAKTVNGTRTDFLVDDQNPTGYAQVLEEIVAGAVERVYTYGVGLIGQQSRDGSIRFFHQDGQESVRLLTDATASQTDTYDYEAFGALLRSTGGTANRYLFRSEQFDSAVNSYYLRARYYRLDTGRFLTADSWSGDVTTPQTLHKYVYTSNNPVMRSDPSGHFGLTEVGAAVGISSMLAGLPSVTPNPQSVQTGGPMKTLVLNVVLWPSPEAYALSFRQFSTANVIYGTNGARIRVEAGFSTALDEAEATRIVAPDKPGVLEVGAEGPLNALKPSLEQERLLRLNRTSGRITVYYVPEIYEYQTQRYDHGLTIEAGHLGQTDPSVFIGYKSAVASTLAHELGHALGNLDDLKEDPSRLMYNVGPRTGSRLVNDHPKERDLIRKSPYLSP